MSALAGLLCISSSLLAQSAYRPGAGDAVQIWRHHFGNDLPKAKEAMLRTMVPMLARDKVVRMTVIAENTATGEMVSVQFSDQFNVFGKHSDMWDEFLRSMSDVHALDKKPYSMAQYRIYGFADEAIVPKAGDMLLMWFHKLTPEGHKMARSHFASKVVPLVKKDANRRDTYFMESDKIGDMANIAISDPSTANTSVHSRSVDPIRKHYTQPMKIERFRIFSVTFENRR